MMTGQRSPNSISSRSISICLAGLLSVAGIASAQDQNQEPHPWRRADAPSEQIQQPQNDQAPPPPNYTANQGFGGQNGPEQPPQSAQPYPRQQQYPQQQYPQQQQYPPMQSVPATLTIRPGTFITVHVDQWLSSDKNQQGDTFFASLAEPLIVDGVVVAQRGQTVRGRVTEAQKAGRVEGTSKLGIELTGLTLVDGSQVGLQSHMVTRNGSTSEGRDAGAIATTTALGAVIGAGADYGRGAAIGAGAGAAAGIIGVLLTRGRPTVIGPESVLTFQIGAPITVATDRAPQAFRYAESRDYGHESYAAEPGPRRALAPPPAYPAYPPPYYGPAYYPYYWGPGLSVYVGPRFSYGGYYYRGSRGFRR